MPKTKTPKRVKKSAKPKATRTPKEVPQLDIEKMFEEIISEDVPEVKQKRRRKRKRLYDGDDDPLVIELIHRIEQIYKMNNYETGPSLKKLDARQLRVHLNRLQWGHIDYITKEKKFPEIDEFPEDGFCCKVYGFDLWVNLQHCQMRAQYPKLYVWCSQCSKWSENG